MKVATTDELEDQQAKLVEVEGQKIALFRVGEAFYALSDTCTHRGGPLSEVLLLFDPTDQTSLQELTAVRAAATARKLQLVERAVVTQADIERVFTLASRENVQAVVVVSGLVTKFPALVIRLAAERHLAIPGHRREWTEQGALFSYGANYFSVGRIDAARLVDRMLKGI